MFNRARGLLPAGRLEYASVASSSSTVSGLRSKTAAPVQIGLDEPKVLVTTVGRAQTASVGRVQAPIHQHLRQEFHMGSACVGAQEPFGAVAVGQSRIE